MSTAIRQLRRRMLAEYTSSIGLPSDARYHGGSRLRPVVPLDVAVGGVLIVGAYPSARFETVGTERDVPVGDNLGPFEPERYFDGDRVRVQASADELQRNYITPLGLERNACWVTDLVKVFLFKAGHREKYARLGSEVPKGYLREHFEELAQKSLTWLAEEVALAKPKLVVTLGAEVAGVVRGVSGEAGRQQLLGKPPVHVVYGKSRVPTVHLVHPGILMRGHGSEGEVGSWPELHSKEHIPTLKAVLGRLTVPIDRKNFLAWAEEELGIRYPGWSVSGVDRNYRCVRCAEGMYLGVDALVDGEMRIHVFTDMSAPRLRVVCAALPEPPPGAHFTMRQGKDAPERLYAGFSWLHAGDDYAQDQTRATTLLDWLVDHVVTPLVP